MKQTDTSASLLMRIRDMDDCDAWNEFSSIYRPAIVRIAQRRGLQNADAEDLAQQVLLSVSKAIERWSPNPEHSHRASFRTWLNRVTTNAVSNAMTRRRPDQGTGKDTVMDMLNQSPAGTADSDLTIEVRREVFRFVAQQIKSEFQPGTWQAFWLTAVEGLGGEEAARRLGRSVGSVYTARSRVMRLLKTRIHELQILEEND